jgi:putative flippase GtrA
MMTSSILSIKVSRSLAKFLVVGVLNTLLSLVIIFGLKYFLSLSDVIANFTGYVAGLICSFILNKKWTFNHTGRLTSTIFKFVLTFFIAYVANIIFVLFFIQAGVNAYSSHLLAMPIYTVIFYLGSKFFVFK